MTKWAVLGWEGRNLLQRPAVVSRLGDSGAVPLLPPSHALMQQAFAASGVLVLGGLDLIVDATISPLCTGALVVPA